MVNVGDIFHFWKVISILKLGKFLCQCKCGKEKTINKYDLVNGRSKSCGCLRKVRAIEVGEIFGNLRTMCCEDNKKALCVCELCGKKVFVEKRNLISGNSKTCGCTRRSAMTKSVTKHGLSKSPESTAWRKTKDKCFNNKNPDFKYYGGRGRVMCERWRNYFENFFADMGPRPSQKHSIDRINNDGNYEPGNCRWATRKIQSMNTRRTMRQGAGVYKKGNKFHAYYSGKYLGNFVSKTDAIDYRNEFIKKEFETELSKA